MCFIVIFMNSSGIPIFKSPTSAIFKIVKGNQNTWELPWPRTTPTFSSGCDFMMGLGKPVFCKDEEKVCNILECSITLRSLLCLCDNWQQTKTLHLFIYSWFLFILILRIHCVFPHILQFSQYAMLPSRKTKGASGHCCGKMKQQYTALLTSTWEYNESQAILKCERNTDPEMMYSVFMTLLWRANEVSVFNISKLEQPLATQRHISNKYHWHDFQNIFSQSTENHSNFVWCMPILMSIYNSTNFLKM